MLSAIREKPQLLSTITVLNSIITKLIYVAYPCLLVVLFLKDSERLSNLADSFDVSLLLSASWLWAFIIPCVSFILLSVVRKLINAPRPYEIFKTAPLIPKTTKGKSFPSRHVFSIFVIGTTFVYTCSIPELGYLIYVLGILLAAIRVVSGVHFPRDVLAGACLGILLAVLGFSIVQ